MTALIGFFSRQIERTTHSTRRLHWLMALLVIIALSGVLLTVQRTPHASTLAYNSRDVAYIIPLENEVCPGETIHYPLITAIEENDIPGRITIDEAWCAVGLSGICKTVVPPSNRNLPLLEPRNIVSSPASRVVPSTLTPGVYQFWHTATDGHGVTKGYIVEPVVITDCEVSE